MKTFNFVIKFITFFLILQEELKLFLGLFLKREGELYSNN